MSDKQQKKKEIISLLSIEKRRMEQMDEQELIQIIEKIDAIRQDSVRDGRFLGFVIRRWKC